MSLPYLPLPLRERAGVRETILYPHLPESSEALGKLVSSRFHVIPANAGIQVLIELQTLWTPVFTGEANKMLFFTPFRPSRGKIILGPPADLMQS